MRKDAIIINIINQEEEEMKRVWLVLLMLIVIAAASTSAMAVDVKFSGEYYAAGLYQDKTTLMKGTPSDGPSTAFYYQRLRVRMDFIVHPGLSLITRFDAMERAWGAARSTPGTAQMVDSAGTRAENENIAWDWAYIEYNSPIGQFKVGYFAFGDWGTDFGNNVTPVGQIQWGYFIEPIGTFVWAKIDKINDNSRTAINNTAITDRDNNQYLAGINFFGIKNTEIGLLYDFVNYRANRSGLSVGPIDYGYISSAHLLSPFVKAKFGFVSVEAEVDYMFGDLIKFEGLHPGAQEVSINNLEAYAKVVADFGFIYAGGIFAYVSGDDPGTTDKVEGGIINGGREFKPCLIMFNSERNDWVGAIPGYNANINPLNGALYGVVDAPMNNAWFFQGRVGVRPIDKLDISASLSYATADKKPTATWLNNDYGWELDLVATYKITNNLTYMLGGGYLFTGKYFKGESELNQLNNDYLILNKLTLTF